METVQLNPYNSLLAYPICNKTHSVQVRSLYAQLYVCIPSLSSFLLQWGSKLMFPLSVSPTMCTRTYHCGVDLFRLQSRQSAKLFLKSSELGIPQPLTCRQGWAKLVLIALERYSVALKRLTFNLR
jgi:hypothetical protein